MLSARRLMATIAASAAAALMAAGCGGGSAPPAARPPSPLQVITLAAQRAGTEHSYAATMSITMSGTVTGTLQGTMRFRTQPSLLGEADYSTVSFNGQSLPGGMREIVAAKTVYVKMAVLAQQLHKPWAAISFAGVKQGTGIDLSQLAQQAQNSNPLVQTQMLAAAKNVRRVGTQTIDGVATTQYAGSFPISAGIARLPAGVRSFLQKAVARLGTQTVRFNVWIDAQHQVRKIVSTTTGGTEQTTTAVQVTSVGQPVRITLPAPAQVFTIPASALRGLPAGAGAA